VRRRYEALLIELGVETPLRFVKDAAPAPIFAEALAVLRAEDPAGADAVASQLEREQRDYVTMKSGGGNKRPSLPTLRR